ncbi:MAG: hypothetical protein M3Z35_02400, partial [Nitrospirota bacterium]|nr:hypothetical protein [Nitrospirota bacterium]
MHRSVYPVVCAGLLSLFMTHPIMADESTPHPSFSQMKVDGEVTEIKSGMIFVKTPMARYTISANTAPADAKVGDKVTLWVNENNIVVDHHRQGTKAIHRFVTGKLVYVGLMKKQIKLWTPEGEKEFPLERLDVKTGGIEEGALVTAELNEAGTVIDLHRAKLDSDMPIKDDGHSIAHLMVDGEVTEIKSGLIFVKTPAAQYIINANTAPADAKV